jgi:hypothetical protein
VNLADLRRFTEDFAERPDFDRALLFFKQDLFLTKATKLHKGLRVEAWNCLWRMRSYDVRCFSILEKEYLLEMSGGGRCVQRLQQYK